MESGSNSFIREMMRDLGLTPGRFSGLRVSRNFAREPGEIDQTPPEGFLYQAGYLSLRKAQEPGSEPSFFLDYPNFEVRSAISKLFMDVVLDSSSDADRATENIRERFIAGDIRGIVKAFYQLFAAITYDDHSAGPRLNQYLSIIQDERLEVTRRMATDIGPRRFRETTMLIKEEIKNKHFAAASDLMDELIEKSHDPEGTRLNLRERFYRAMLHSFLLGAGLRVTAELHNNLGRSDLIVEAKDKIYVLEIKVAAKTGQAETAANVAMGQIREKGYGKPYPNPILIGLAISEETRNVAACFFERDKTAHQLEIEETAEIETPTAGSAETDETGGPRPR
jgi:hypothetical protein